MKPQHALLASALTALGASACCVLPLVLTGLGLAGAGLSILTALQPLQPLLVVMALALLGAAGWRLYHIDIAIAPSCELAEACAAQEAQRHQRAIFWVAGAAILVLLLFPLYAPLLY